VPLAVRNLLTAEHRKKDEERQNAGRRDRERRFRAGESRRVERCNLQKRLRDPRHVVKYSRIVAAMT